MRKEKLPYEGSRLTPEQSRNGIEKLVRDAGCKDYQWTVLGGQYQLKFALPVKLKGMEKMIAFKFLPPLIPKVIREYDPKQYKYVKRTINDDVVAFRVLFWYLKNKIVAVKTGLVSAEYEFMANILYTLPDGSEQTLGEKLEDQLLALPTAQGFAVLPAPEPKRQGDSKIVDGESRVQ